MAITVYEKIKKISKTFPNSPGVYFYLDGAKKPIYIGRAGSLKKRIASYFRTKDPRIAEMVRSAKGLKFEKTATLLEAIILEANLIKKYWPKYNIQEKDNKSFDYLVITKDKYPRILTVRGRELQKFGAGKAKIFGPYQSYRLLRTALGLVRKIFPFGKCQPGQGRPCFDYQIGLCPGICIGEISAKDYKKNIDNIALFFGGQKKRLLKKLKKMNPPAGGPEKIAALKHVADIALLQQNERIGIQKGDGVFGRVEGYDISHLSGKDPVGAMVVFENGEKNPAEYRLFKIKDLKGGKNYSDIDMLKEVLERRFNHKEWSFPDVVFVDGGMNQVKAAKEILAKRNIFIPIVGLAKIGGHSASAYMADKLIIANSKRSGRELLISSKKIFQAIRNEAHRSAISFNRRRGRGF
ncbi:MAG: GIY-YIG nuclease family protein [Patescibacteria group bacterium]|nr:GIY-YIG nuclease family protein [Patescibacteria group bacterium]